MSNTQGDPVMVEHYECRTKEGYCYRWKIVDADGLVIVKGMRNNGTMMDSKTDLRNIIEFLEAVERESTRKAFAGAL